MTADVGDPTTSLNAPRRGRRRGRPRRVGATSCRSPIARPAQPRTLNGRRNADTAIRTSISLQSSGGISMPSVGVTKRSTSGRYARQRRTASRALSTSSGSIVCACSSFARTLSPYSSARDGNVARCDSAASWKKSGHVSPGASGIVVSTTRAPSASSCATYCSAERLSSTAAPPTDGGRVSSPIVSPSSRGSGTASPVSADHISATSATLVAIGPTVS